MGKQFIENYKNIIDGVCEKFSSFIEKARPKALKLPTYLLLCSALQRPGESAMQTSSRIITSLGEQGFPTGTMPNGDINMMNPFIYTVVKELIRSRKFDGATFSVIPKGSLQILSTFSGPGGSGTGYGVNITDTVIGGTSV